MIEELRCLPFNSDVTRDVGLILLTVREFYRLTLLPFFPGPWSQYAIEGGLRVVLHEVYRRINELL